MQKLIGQVSGVTYELGPYNRQGHSDYWWLRHDGVSKEVERKTWPEILGGIEKIEEQLSRHLSDRPNAEHILLLEGPINEVSGKVHTYSTTGAVFTQNRQYGQPMAGVYAWLYQIAHYYTIIPTYTLAGSSAALVAMFKSDGKDEHSTLKRHYSIRTFNRDPIVERYMAIFDGIGETKAEVLRNAFPTIKSLVSAGRNDFITLPGFGPAIADRVMRSLGSFTQPKIKQVK